MTCTRIFLGILSVAVLATPALAAQAAPNCEEWNTRKFFQTATVEDVTACLAAGADTTAGDKYKWTPLHWAAMYNENPMVIEALLAAGADLESRDNISLGGTPLHWAAAQNENPAVIKALLAAGAALESRDTKYGGTPLHWAAGNNENLAFIEALLKAGADPMVRDESGSTPLHRAAQNKNSGGPWFRP